MKQVNDQWDQTQPPQLDFETFRIEDGKSFESSDNKLPEYVCKYSYWRDKD